MTDSMATRVSSLRSCSAVHSRTLLLTCSPSYHPALPILDLAELCERVISVLFACPLDSVASSSDASHPASAAPRLSEFIAYALHRTRLPLAVTHQALYLLKRLKCRFPAAKGSSGHRLFISALMLASKSTCDDTYSNKSWTIVGQGLFSLREINQMERELFGYLGFRVNVQPEELDEFVAGLEQGRIHAPPGAVSPPMGSTAAFVSQDDHDDDQVAASPVAPPKSVPMASSNAPEVTKWARATHYARAHSPSNSCNDVRTTLSAYPSMAAPSTSVPASCSDSSLDRLRRVNNGAPYESAPTTDHCMSPKSTTSYLSHQRMAFAPGVTSRRGGIDGNTTAGSSPVSHRRDMYPSETSSINDMSCATPSPHVGSDASASYSNTPSTPASDLGSPEWHASYDMMPTASHQYAYTSEQPAGTYEKSQRAYAHSTSRAMSAHA